MTATEGTEAKYEKLYAKLNAYMSKQGLRSTSQRRTITEVFFDGPNHVTIEDLLAQVRKKDPRVGYATVYRTLKLFTECGIAEERKFGDGPSRFELSDESAHHHHDHLICVDCNKIIEFHDDQIERLQEQVAKQLGFVTHSHKHEIYGQCASCAAPS